MSITNFTTILIGIVTSLFLYFSHITIKRVRAKPLQYKNISQIKYFYDIYLMFTNNPYIAPIYKTINNKLELSTMHTVLGACYTITIMLLYPCMSVLLFSILMNFVTRWYMLVGNILISFILPLLYLRSYIRMRVLKVLIKLADTYYRFGSYLATTPKIDEVVKRIISESTGSIKTLFILFDEEYSISRDKAYRNFQNRVRDYFAESFCHSLLNFETTGSDITEVIHDISSMAAESYREGTNNFKEMRTLKLVGLLIIGFSFYMPYACKMAVTGFGDNIPDATAQPAFYVLILLEALYMTLCFAFSE